METGSVCVIGAGITGMSVTNNLARAGVKVSLVDKNPYPGGQAIFYGCKAGDACVHCGVCLVHDALKALRENPLATCHFSASPASLRVSPDSGGYRIELSTRPNPIDWRSCTECGLCLASCPRGAIKQVPGWKYFIDTASCNSCGDCVAACPGGAIRLDREPETMKVDAQGIVVAAGFHPFDPSANRKWGYGGSPRVMTGSEMERLFSAETYLPEGARKIAFVQCVGSRDVREGQPHCSRVCCAFALRMANRIVTEFPEAAIDVYYMDIQHFGKDFDRFFAGLGSRVSFRRANPICVADQGENPLLRFESLTDLACRESSYDLVVLSNGMSPPEDSEELAEIFGLDLDSQGYLQVPGRISATGPERGVFVAGSCRQPMLIEESVEDASAVSHRVLRHLGVT